MSTDQGSGCRSCVSYPSSKLPFSRYLMFFFNYNQNLKQCEEVRLHRWWPPVRNTQIQAKFKKPQKSTSQQFVCRFPLTQCFVRI